MNDYCLDAMGTHTPRHYVAQPDELNLLEDGLQLWAVALCNAPRPEPQLLNLFPNLLAVVRRSTGLPTHFLCPMSSIAVLLGQWQ